MDDYLCQHAVEEFKALPVIEVKSLLERIAEATPENYRELLPEVASVEDEIQKEILCKALSETLGVTYRTARKEVEAHSKNNKPIITDNNIVIAHPSYEVGSDFLSLGFRETVICDDEPKDKNLYILATGEGYRLCEDRVLKLQDKSIVFNAKNRHLLRAEDKWRKEKILSFIKQPAPPVGVYYEIKQLLKQYVELQREAVYGLLAAWIIATYFFLIFHAFPFLFIFGKKQTGKSRLLDLLERLCFNSVKVRGISVAALSDTLDGIRGTFLNDQAESLSDSRNTELLGILADSYTCGGGKRRIVDISNKGRRVVEFSTYAPKAFASTSEIDADLKDRCIQIIMLRSLKDYPYPEPYLPVWHDMRDKLYRLLLTKWREVKDIYQSTGEGVTHRVRELWRPLETILILENVPSEEIQDIKGFFLESMQETQSELSDSEIEIFEILLQELEKSGEGTFTVEDIAKKMQTRPREGMSDRGLQTWVGKVLRQFSLYDQQAGRRGKKRAYCFSYEHVKNVFERYYTGGLSGEVVKMAEIKDFSDTTSKSGGGIGGNEVVNVQPDTTYTTFEPPIKTEVVTPNTLKNKENYHITTLTTCAHKITPAKCQACDRISWCMLTPFQRTLCEV